MKLRLVAFSCLLAARLPAAEDSVSNDSFRLRLAEGGAIAVESGTVSRTFEPVFTVISSSRDPELVLQRVDIPKVSYNVPTWLTTGEADSFKALNTRTQGGDGVEMEKTVAQKENRTADVFRSGDVRVIRATGGKLEGRKVTWSFADPELSAWVELPEGKGEPVLGFTFTPKEKGWYSIGYTGAPQADPAAVAEIWQPLIWLEKRFPTRSYLTAGGMCPLPTCLVTADGATVGVLAAPSELPFQPLPRWQNSRFGVALRNQEGLAQPMIFAPMPGGSDSKLEAGQPFSFKALLVVRAGDLDDTFEYLARSAYGFGDLRRNVSVSLNKTLENMIDYGLSEYSRFDPELRGCMYETDVPGAVKNVSSLHPLAMALVTDNEAIFRERARPIMEFLLSREKSLFVLDPEMKIQDPSRFLRGPCAPVSELTALYDLSGKRTPLFLDYAVQKTKKDSDWVRLLALHRADSARTPLSAVTAAADEYLAERTGEKQSEFATNLSRGSMFFWTEFVPVWIPLLELYEATGEKRYLEAAHQAAREFAQFIYFCPLVPTEDVLVNKDGKAPQYWYLSKKGHLPMSAPEEKVPAWRLSEIGLTPESAGTAAGHRAILLATHAPWMLRLAEYTNDSFLHDIARSAIVGRYENFPGYHINTERTTVYEKADYPLHAHKDLSYNSFHYNHVWPHIVLLLDYLVSDAFYRSRGAIDFPSHYAEGYAYLQNKIYGDRPGEIYGEKGAWLWMPKGLVSIDNPQLNYLAARGDHTLYVVLTNQSPDPVKARVRLDAGLVAFDSGAPQAVRVWEENQKREPVPLKDGAVEASVAGKGITVLAFDGVTPRVGFQEKWSRQGGAGSKVVPMETGDAKGMLISFGPQLTHAYVYLSAMEDQVKEARLHYREGETWKVLTDAKYPFEFSVDWNRPEAFEYSVEVVHPDGSSERSESVLLAPAKS